VISESRCWKSAGSVYSPRTYVTEDANVPNCVLGEMSDRAYLVFLYLLSVYMDGREGIGWWVKGSTQIYVFLCFVFLR